MAVITIDYMNTLQNFLNADTLTLAFEEIEVLKKKGDWVINRNFWNAELYEKGIIGAVGITHAGTQLAKVVVDTLLPHLPKTYEIKVYHYLWYPLSGINMHDDGGATFGATIYLTPEWDVNWGGLFVYKDKKNKLQVNFPTYNSININVDRTHHMVTPVSPLAPYPRHTLQIWGIK